MSTQPPPSKNSKILILGAGTFGISTAYHLALAGYENITVLDRDEVPSRYSAGTDLNKIVRAEYGEGFYTELALEAIDAWKKPPLKDCYIQTGFLNCVSSSAPPNALQAVKDFHASIASHPAFANSLTTISPSDNIKELIPSTKGVSGKLEGWTGYFNSNAGYARAQKAIQIFAEECVKLGVKFVTGEEAGCVVSLTYSPSPTSNSTEKETARICTGALTANGTHHAADLVIVCMGAYAPPLIPELGKQVTAKAWAVGEMQLTREEAGKLRGMPVINCRDFGFLFEPDLDTGVLKMCNKGAGYTSFTSTSSSSTINSGDKISLPRNLNGIPEKDEKEMRDLLKEILPHLAEREFITKKMCWCSDAADENYILDFVPGTRGLVVVGGDSGHGFKMFPVVGRWVREFIEGEKREERWMWKVSGGSDGDVGKIPWRLGRVRDLGDLDTDGDEEKRKGAVEVRDGGGSDRKEESVVVDSEPLGQGRTLMRAGAALVVGLVLFRRFGKL